MSEFLKAEKLPPPASSRPHSPEGESVQTIAGGLPDNQHHACSAVLFEYVVDCVGNGRIAPIVFDVASDDKVLHFL